MRELGGAAGEQDEDEVGADQRRGRRGRRRGRPTSAPARAACARARSSARSGCARPRRRRPPRRRRRRRPRRGSKAAANGRGTATESARISDDRGHDEPEAADERAGDAADAVGAEDRELGRGRPGQQAAGRVGVLELSRVEPGLALDHEPAQQRDVGGRTAEAGSGRSTSRPRAIAPSRAATGRSGTRR